MAEAARPGRLKLFLGYAAGVGKTYRMLSEAGELARARRDVVIGYFEPHARAETIALALPLETVPRRRIAYRGTKFEEMDVEAIVRRHPEICAVDEFAHSNIPGCVHAKRWEDVLELLAAGIDVLTTLNVQHIESLNDQIAIISGVRVRETVPDWVVQRADEVVMVDLTPQALLNRLQRGVVYRAAEAERAREHFFRESTLTALRELALRQTAQQVEGQAPLAGSAPAAAGPGDRILIHITGDPATAMLIRRGRRVADFLHAPCFAVHIADARDDATAVERHLRFARNLRIETRSLPGPQVAEALVDFAQLHAVTQIFLARAAGRRLGLALLTRIVHLARDLQVTIVADRPQGRERGC